MLFVKYESSTATEEQFPLLNRAVIVVSGLFFYFHLSHDAEVSVIADPIILIYKELSETRNYFMHPGQNKDGCYKYFSLHGCYKKCVS